MKLSGNDLCWCMSGKKYKHCHLGLEAEPRMHIGEWHNAFLSKMKVGYCSVPDGMTKDCDLNIVKAHTVQKSTSLKAIARNNKVYALDSSPISLEKNKGKFTVGLISIKSASTVKIFCSKHDSELFEDIEKKLFVGCQKQCFLHGFRAICMEFYKKKQAADFHNNMPKLDSGLPLETQIRTQINLFNLKLGTEIGLGNIKWHKDEYDRCLASKDYDDVRAYVVKFQAPPPVMCSGSVFTDFDFDGRALSDLSDFNKTPDAISFNLFMSGGHGFAVFSWLRNPSNMAEKLIASLELIPNVNLADALLRFFFSSVENIYISPDWWEALTESCRVWLLERMEVGFSPFVDVPSNVYVSDEVRFVEWPVLERYRVGY